MKNSTMLRLQLNEAFDWLDQVIEDLTPEQYAWQPQGSANPISKLHAHTLSSADFWMNLMGLQKPMLWMGVSQKLGLPSNCIEVWKTDAPINLATCRTTRRTCARPAWRSRRSKTPTWSASHRAGLRQADVGFVIRLSAMQLAIHTGEISAAKGMQGLQGLPF